MDVLKPIEATAPIENHTSPPSSDNGDEANLVPLKGFFGINDLSGPDHEAIKYIYEFYSRNGIQTTADMLLNIRDVERRIGMSALGENRAIMVRNYLKILNGIEDLTKQKNAYER